MIELKDICIEYDRVILDHASISIPAHSITLIRGKSGSGKTALLYCIALVLRLWIQKASINTIMIIIS